MERNQLEMELRFSREGSDFLVYDAFINDCAELIGDLVIVIDLWRGGEFWPEKSELVSRLPESEFIVIELLCTVLGKVSGGPIQGYAIELGSRLGYTDIIEQAKVGSSVLGLCHGDLYDIILNEDSTLIEPKLELSSEDVLKLQGLCFLPPNLVPAVWRSNYGGWKWSKKSVILGSGNHHTERQGLDALNIIQRIPWTIDLDVYTNESSDNLPYNFEEILGHYVGERFYFTWQFDKRGRMYSSGYQLNPQGDEYGKALLSPVHGEVLTDAGFQALEDSVRDLVLADKQILARKGAKAIQRAYAGEPVAHFIELDATCSGYQMMACLSGCLKTGLLCNLLSEPRKQDLYMTVLKAVEAAAGEDLGYTRADVKKAIMTSAYNSKAMPAAIFGEHIDIFWSVLRELLPGAMAVMDILNDYWDPYALEHKWVMPDGHVVIVKVREPDELRIGIDELDGRRFTLRYNRNQPSSNSRSLVPNIIHSVDAYVAREMIRRCDFELSCIHDCFQFHPNHAEEVKDTYREILFELTGMNLLANICSQLMGRGSMLELIDEGLGDEILKSTYALT